MVEESVSTSRMESSRGKIRFPQAMVASRLHTGFRIQGLMFKIVYRVKVAVFRSLGHGWGRVCRVIRNTSVFIGIMREY